MSICVCVNRTIDGNLRVVLDGSSFWADWHHCILYRHFIQVYLKKNTIRIIMTIMYIFVQSLNVIDTIIIIFIHSLLVSMVT